MATADAPAVDAALRRQVTLLDLVMLGAGTAIGAAIFSVLGPATKLGGASILITVGLAAIPMVIFALVYAWLGSALPRTAASYEWQRQFTRPWFAFAVVWMRVLSNAVLLVVMGQVLMNYLSAVIHLPARPVIFGLFLIVFALNYRGVALAARAQTAMMALLLAVFAVFVAASAPHLRPELFVEAARGGWTPILAALPLMIQLFLGIETATEVGGEVKSPNTAVPLGVAGALALTVVVYFAVAFAALSVAGPERLASSPAPLVTAAQLVLGRLATPLVLTAAVLALLKSTNAIFLVFSRFLFAMGRDGVLPRALGQVHPRYGTPHVATVIALLAASACLLLPSSLMFLLIAVNIPTMAKYLGSCLAAFVAAGRADVVAKAKLPLSPVLVRTLAVLGAAAAVGIAAAGFGADRRPYLLLAAWVAAGMAWFFVSRSRERRGAQLIRP